MDQRGRGLIRLRRINSAPSRLLKNSKASLTRTRLLDSRRPGDLFVKATPRRGRAMNVAGGRGRGSASCLAPCTLSLTPLPRVGVVRPPGGATVQGAGGIPEDPGSEDVAPDARCLTDQPVSGGS
jgi:hypothetical protein